MSPVSAACHSLALLTADPLRSVWLLADPTLLNQALRLVLLALHHPNSDTLVWSRQNPPLPTDTKTRSSNLDSDGDCNALQAHADARRWQREMPPHLNVGDLHAQTLGVVPAHVRPREQAEILNLPLTRRKGGRPTRQIRTWRWMPMHVQDPAH